MGVIDDLIESGKKFKRDSNDEYSRYKSWEFCYAKFKNSDNYNENEEDKIDELAIHLSFYLASWGMYRGSTFLLNKNYKINCGIVKIIKAFQTKYKKYFSVENKEQLKQLLTKDNFFDDIEKLGNDIETHYSNCNIYNKGVTDTLKTKIIMGTLGITPAYDTYFREAIDEINKIEGYNISKTFKKESIRDWYQFYYDHFDNFESLRKETDYPIMKILDMCLWQHQIDKKK